MDELHYHMKILINRKNCGGQQLVNLKNRLKRSGGHVGIIIDKFFALPAY